MSDTISQSPSVIPALICPYCRFPLQIGDEAGKACDVCGTVHHVECWAENEGCAVALCAGGMVRSEPEHREIPERRVPLVVTLDEGEVEELVVTTEPVARRRRPVLIGLLALLTAAAIVVAILVGFGVLGVLGVLGALAAT